MARANWPIVVGGCHRSGTSVLRRVLDAHSRIHCGPEVKFFRDFYGDYFDDPLDHLRFARSARSLLDEDELLDVLGGAFVELHERAARGAGKERWADKVPENVVYTDQWERLLGQDWLFIHVVRNPLDTLTSMTEAGFPLSFPPGLEERIDFYVAYNEAGLRFGDEHPDRYHRVVYEALAARPEGVLAELMTSLGEQLEPEQLAFNDGTHQQGLEDPKVAQTTEVHSTSVHRWPSVLGPDEAALVWSRTRALWARIDPDDRYVSPPPLGDR
jgi:Sulfotransferase family